MSVKVCERIFHYRDCNVDSGRRNRIYYSWLKRDAFSSVFQSSGITKKTQRTLLTGSVLYVISRVYVIVNALFNARGIILRDFNCIIMLLVLCFIANFSIILGIVEI